MASENLPMDPYDAVLADLRSKREQINTAIRAIEMLRNGGAFTPMTGGDATVGEDIVETAGMYLGMSIPDATRKLLAAKKRTLGNAEIARELKAGGLVLQSIDPMNTIGSVLTRRFSQVGDIVRVDRGTWGLKEWYPNRTFKPNVKTANGQSTVTPSPNANEPEPRAEPNPDVQSE